MGYYIEQDSTNKPMPKFGKADALLADGATRTTGKQFEPNLVCVADRMTHDAAIYCYDEREYERVCRGNEGEEEYVTWLIHPKAKVLSKCPH